jgi:hypothetical protein
LCGRRSAAAAVPPKPAGRRGTVSERVVIANKG